MFNMDIIRVTVFLAMATVIKVASEENEIKAYMGSTVALPCRLDTQVCGNLHSVKFYRETSRIYVYSQVGGVARAEGDATQRMKVEYSQDKMEALLKINPVEIEDEATYKCEITYLEVLENCDVVQLIKLKTLVKPNAVRLLHPNGQELTGPVLGPYNEGTKVEVTCEAIGGRPIPDVKWYNGSTEVKSKYISVDNHDGTGTGMAKLELMLSRGDLRAKFECRVESAALEEPIISSFTADVNVRPTGITLYGVNGSVTQGANVKLKCDVTGAKPPAEVRWFNKSTPITNEKLISTEPQVMRDGTYTTRSTLAFQATRWENGISFHCYADNSVIRDQKESDLQSVLIVDVEYPPVVTISVSNTTVNETDDTILSCTYVSNPSALLGVIWKKDGQNLTLNDERYDGGSADDLALVIRNISREDIGEYKCVCRNKVGTQESETGVYLNVQYTPSVAVKMDPSTPVRAEDKGNVTLFCEVTAGNPSTLSKVKWFLNGELILELPECNYTTYDEAGNGEGYGGPYCGIDSSVLVLLNVSETFAGQYSCQGKNVVGWGPTSDDQELVVFYPPKGTKLRSTPKKIVKRASVTLHCSVEKAGMPEEVTYEWYRGSHLVPEVNTANWTISPVTLETKSNFTCIAKNAGGSSSPASLSLDVLAPPAFIQNLTPYLGVLMSSENIMLTCRVECYPLCKIQWFKDDQRITRENNKYHINEMFHPPDTKKNDFESIESTLIWKLANWPGNQLDKTANNSYYTCQSTGNEVGSGVNSTTEIAVDYPPDNLTATPRIVKVKENDRPEEISCAGKGHPQLSYTWKTEDSNKILSNTNKLSLKAVTRADSGRYICEASNKHGANSTYAFIEVQYVPECTLESVVQDGRPTLVCTAHANPQEVTFTFRIKGDNDTVDTSEITASSLKGYLPLDSGIDSFRTYQCFVTNAVGVSAPCERDVAGTVSWWKQFANEKIIILIAVAVGIIVCIIIICIIIILVCRRKRAGNKYNNPVEMEEREKPDGQSNTFGQSKWPLNPGVLVHGTKLQNISRITSLGQFKCTSVTNAAGRRCKYKKSKSKIYCRLERLKDLLCIKDQDSLPLGVYRDPNNIVTFRKFSASATNAAKPELPPNPPPTRKRKKPGYLPNQSSMGDKGNFGGAPQGGGIADPLNDPEKLFYENLPFHGMQNPPNKPISIISPIVQTNPNRRNQLPTSPSWATNQNTLNSTLQDRPKVVRNQSFHGFRNPQNAPLTTNAGSSTQIAKFSHQDLSNIKFSSPMFTTLPHRNAIKSIRTNPNCINRSLTNMTSFSSQLNISNPAYDKKPSVGRVIGRNEHKLDIRRTASGINNFQKSNDLVGVEEPKADTQEITAKKQKKEMRFGSLELRKHRCYSPTFYSMRCKKHSKRKPIIYAILKRPKCGGKSSSMGSFRSVKSEEPTSSDYQNLTDSIQIFEQNAENSENENKVPQPAPRCKKHSRSEIIYANVAKDLKGNSESNLDSSNNSSVRDAEISVIEAVVHDAPKLIESNAISSNNTLPKISSKSTRENEEKSRNQKVETKTCKVISTPKPQIVEYANKSPITSVKVTPTLKVSPNFIKPKTESPKGALYMQLHAKLKNSPSQLSQSTSQTNTSISSSISSSSLKIKRDNSTKPSLEKKESVGKFVESSDSTESKNTSVSQTSNPEIMSVPKMPILDTELTLRRNNVLNVTQNAFYTLTTPHYKHATKSPTPQQYSTIPHHPKHMKLIPRSLFQDQQISKSKSFSSKSKPKKHFQIPLQKCHSFKFQTAESYFQPIKNIHEENLMRNGYASDMTPPYRHETRGRNHRKDKHKPKGPLVVRRPGDYQENVQFQENVQNSVQLQYPQPVLARSPNGVVYADLDMPKQGSVKQYPESTLSLGKHQKTKPKTEYATLKFNDIGQEIDV